MEAMSAPPPDGIEVHEDVPLARHTYLRLGGPARYFAIPEDVAQLERLLAWARGEALSVRVLGGGSNLLVADAGVDALVVSLRRAAGSYRFEGERASASVSRAGSASVSPSSATAPSAKRTPRSTALLKQTLGDRYGGIRIAAIRCAEHAVCDTVVVDPDFD